MLKKIFCLMLIVVPCFAGAIDYAPAQIEQRTPGTAYTVNSVLTTTAMQGSPQKPLSSGFTPLELAMRKTYMACAGIDEALCASMPGPRCV